MTLREAMVALTRGEMTRDEFGSWMRARLSELRMTPEMTEEQRLLSELELLSLEAEEGIRPEGEFDAAARRILNELPSENEIVVEAWPGSASATTDSSDTVVFVGDFPEVEVTQS